MYPNYLSGVALRQAEPSGSAKGIGDSGVGDLLAARENGSGELSQEVR